MITLVALIIGIVSLILVLSGQGLGCIGLILGAIVFISGNRITRQRKEARRHEELLDALRTGKRDNFDGP